MWRDWNTSLPIFDLWRQTVSYSEGMKTPKSEMGRIESRLCIFIEFLDFLNGNLPRIYLFQYFISVICPMVLVPIGFVTRQNRLGVRGFPTSSYPSHFHRTESLSLKFPQRLASTENNLCFFRRTSTSELISILVKV